MYTDTVYSALWAMQCLSLPCGGSSIAWGLYKSIIGKVIQYAAVGNYSMYIALWYAHPSQTNPFSLQALKNINLNPLYNSSGFSWLKSIKAVGFI